MQPLDGEDQVAEAQRRLTTIVAADIAGFSRLVGIDEEATLAAQRSHRAELIEPLLAKHQGRIANTAGDSFLFEFPSAVEAVRCSIAVQNGMAERNRYVACRRTPNVDWRRMFLAAFSALSLASVGFCLIVSLQRLR